MSGTSNFAIAGYVPGGNHRAPHMNVSATAPYLTDIILASVAANKTGSMKGCCLNVEDYQMAKEIRAASDGNIKLWVSIGGVGRGSNSFLEMITIKKIRFLDNIIKLCRRHNLDGIDLDWESPKSREDMNAYVSLLIDAADALHDHGCLISVTTRQFFPNTVVEKMDRINLMAYDLVQYSNMGQQQHATTQQNRHHAALDSVTNLVENLIYNGCPREKIILGLPAYARHGKNPNNVRSFAELVDDGYRDLGKSSYKGYMFDSPGRIKTKVALAKEKGLGGIYVWELGQDKQVRGAPGGMLLQAAADGHYTFKTTTTTSGEDGDETLSSEEREELGDDEL